MEKQAGCETAACGPYLENSGEVIAELLRPLSRFFRRQQQEASAVFIGSL
jgi:hypothetical protein